MTSLLAYASQFTKNGSGDVAGMVKTMNGFFGGRIGSAYAEPFFTHEVLGLSGIDQIF